MSKLINKNKLLIIAGLLVTAMFFIADRYLKSLALSRAGEEALPLIPEWLYFTFSTNEFIAFSLPLPNNFALLISAIITIGLILMALKLLIEKQFGLTFLLLTFIIIGAISNLLDRFQYGYVIDYISVSNLTVLNLADVMISLGAIIYLLCYLRKGK